MKNKYDGFTHIALVAATVLLIIGALGFLLWQNFVNAASISGKNQPTSTTNTDNLPAPDIKLDEWRVGFASKNSYDLKLNPTKGTYFISIKDKELADTCQTPDKPLLAMVNRYNPQDKVQNGSKKGQTYSQVFRENGKTIEGKLYVSSVQAEFCTRGKDNPLIEKAAQELESEIKSLRSY